MHAIERRRLSFTVEAHDRVDLTSRRTHRRTVTDAARFHPAMKDKSDAATSARDSLAAAFLSDFLGAVTTGAASRQHPCHRFGAATAFRQQRPHRLCRASSRLSRRHQAATDVLGEISVQRFPLIKDRSGRGIGRIRSLRDRRGRAS